MTRLTVITGLIRGTSDGAFVGVTSAFVPRLNQAELIFSKSFNAACSAKVQTSPVQTPCPAVLTTQPKLIHLQMKQTTHR